MTRHRILAAIALVIIASFAAFFTLGDAPSPEADPANAPATESAATAPASEPAAAPATDPTATVPAAAPVAAEPAAAPVAEASVTVIAPAIPAATHP